MSLHPAKRASAVTSALPTAHLGRLVGLRQEDEMPLVVLNAQPQEPLPARSLIPLDALRRAVDEEVALVFADGAEEQPIIIGVVQKATSKVSGQLDKSADGDVDVYVDKQRVVLEGQEQVVLRCGEASIELHRNGKLVIRGVHVVTHAEGVNRIRGGSVQIN